MIQFKINFGGFYCSIYSDIIDSVIESEISEGYLKNDDNINYRNIFKNVAEHICDTTEEYVNDLLHYYSIDINFIELSSPKFYNYSTDTIISEISESDYKILFNYYRNKTDFIEYVNEASKNRSGFISFYDGIESVESEPSIFLEYLFDWLINLEYDEYICMTTDMIHETIYNNLIIQETT